MRKLDVIRILDFYDVAQLFVGIDRIGTKYLCLLYEVDGEGELKYISVSVSDERLNDFIKGHIDLLNMFKDAKLEDPYFTVKMNEDGLYADHYDGDLQEFMMPEEGYFFDDTIDDDEEMLLRSTTTGCPVIKLAFQTNDNRHDIDAKCLSKALSNFQSLITNCYGKIYNDDTKGNSRLRVTTFQAASFDVEFIANEKLDIFGQSKIGATMETIDKLFSDTDEDVIDSLRKLRGNVVTNYRIFLETMTENELSFVLKWIYDRNEQDIRKHSVSREKIEILQSIVNKNKETEEEDVVFDGVFTAANVSNGKWTFQPFKSKKMIKGDCSQISLLQGVTLSEKNYKIKCKSKLEINETTQKEKNNYKLISFQ